MEKLEMLQAKRDEILDKINNHNHEVALLREELDSVQYRIGIQRLLSEKGDLLKDEKVKEGIEWISIAQMIEGLEKKWEAVSRPSPCCEKEEVEKLHEENEGLKAQLEAAMAELGQMQRERAAEAIQMIHRNAIWPFPFPRF